MSDMKPEISEAEQVMRDSLAGAVTLSCIAIPVALCEMRREERAGKLRVVP